MNRRITDRMFSGSVKERCEKVRKKGVRSDYVERDEVGNIVSVKCRVCGTPIAGWVDAEKVKEEKKDGQRIVYVKQRLMHFANYARIKLGLSNGIAYEPNMCKRCAEKVKKEKDPEMLEAILCCDFEAWARGFERKGLSREEHEKVMKLVHEATVKEVL